jgi:hypothetical protein
MKSPLISGLRHTTIRSESPGASVTCSAVGAGLWAFTDAMSAGTATTERSDRRSNFRIVLTGFQELTASRQLVLGPPVGHPRGEAHEVCLRWSSSASRAVSPSQRNVPALLPECTGETPTPNSSAADVIHDTRRGSDRFVGRVICCDSPTPPRPKRSSGCDLLRIFGRPSRAWMQALGPNQRRLADCRVAT